MIYTYTMIDPRTGNPFYVGQSIHPQHRLNQHITTRFRALPGNVDLTPTQLRIREICDAGLEPTLKIVEEVPNYLGARLSEHTWIQKLNEQGYQLTNKLAVIGNLGEKKQHNIVNDKIAELGYMTTIEAAHFLMLTPGRVRTLVSQGKLHVKKLGGMNLYSINELMSYNENKTGGGRRKSS